MKNHANDSSQEIVRAASLTSSTAVSVGAIELASPVILAPMAGVTSMPFRILCRELELSRTGSVSGLYVCEMITARALLERVPKTMTMIRFDAQENPRSLQLYTVDPETTYRAVDMIVQENLADHIDLNFGCPVPKVTRKGGGSAIPYKRNLYRNIVKAAVQGVSGSGIPITVKFRKGIDDEHLTYLDAGAIAEQEGVAAVTLHARTAAQLYSGNADWEAIAKLKAHVTSIPVFGNGDIYNPEDALAMRAATGCDGVVIGRGCLGRPWLFAELSLNSLIEPSLPEVGAIMYRHAELLSNHLGEKYAMRDFRKHTSWYLRGFGIGGQVRTGFALVESLNQLADLISRLPDYPFPPEGHTPRGRQGSPATVHLPHGWLDDPWDAAVPCDAEIQHSGG